MSMPFDVTPITEIKYAPRTHLYISHSSRQLLRSCARKFEFRKFYIHPGRETSLAAEVGKALHVGLQDFLVNGDEDAAIFKYMLEYPIEICSNPMDDRSLEAGYATLMALISCTPLLEYEIAQINCLDGVVRPAIEVPFEIIIDGFDLGVGQFSTVSYVGYIDAILYNRVTGQFRIVDVKTTKRVDKDLSPKYIFSEQCIPYGLVLEYMQGYPINGFDVAYLVGGISILDPNAQIHTFPKSQLDIQDWFKGLLIDLVNIKMFQENDWFPRSGGGDGCFSWNKPCYFMDICSTRDKDVIQSVINQAGDLDKPNLDEALKSKALVPEFKPWVQFKLPVPT